VLLPLLLPSANREAAALPSLNRQQEKQGAQQRKSKQKCATKNEMSDLNKNSLVLKTRTHNNNGVIFLILILFIS
jgi:hypothetical protein